MTQPEVGRTLINEFKKKLEKLMKEYGAEIHVLQEYDGETEVKFHVDNHTFNQWDLTELD